MNAQSFKATDLMDLGTETYKGFEGGLYENGSNQMPSDHDQAGLAVAAKIQPLDANGNPSPNGRIVMTSIGMSNASDDFSSFVSDVDANPLVNHATLTVVNGALPDMTACYWTFAFHIPTCGLHVPNQYDRVRDTVLSPLNLTEQQVQVVWIMVANPNPGLKGCGRNGNEPCNPLCDVNNRGCQNTVTDTEATRYESQLGQILRAAKTRWPNLQLAFISSRIYAGYATVSLNPEPFAYEYGFSTKWAIQAQINQIRNGKIDPVAGNLDYTNGTAPWIAWASYNWADGVVPRSDGLVWCDGQHGDPCFAEVDFEPDGTHPSAVGSQKVAGLMLNYFLNSPYATGWFLAH